MTLAIPWIPHQIRLVRNGSEPLPDHATLTAGVDWIVPVEMLSDSEIEQLGAEWIVAMKAKRDSRRAGEQRPWLRQK